MTNYFTWNDFDRSVDFIAKEVNSFKFNGIYGIPRGGLCLAVALSHKLNVKLISKPVKNSLILDDVYETGQTLDSFRNIEGAIFYVLFSKKTPTWWNAVHLTKKKEWIVFPWENKRNTVNDQKEYFKKRS